MAARRRLNPSVMRARLFFFAGLLGWWALGAVAGARAAPLQVMLIPSDGGTEDGTRSDYAPLFAAVERNTGLTFEIRVAQSYSAVIEALAHGMIDIAYLGTAAFLTAQDRGPVELLAIGETEGSFHYYSGLFTRVDSGVTEIAQIRGRSLALTDPSSSSGFVYPMALLLKHGIEPARDCSRVVLSGSHTNSLTALQAGHVEVCAAPFESYIKAVRQGIIDPRVIRILAKSDPIPNPPLALNGRLPAELKARLRDAFDQVHTMPGVQPQMIRGHAGSVVERYNAHAPAELFTLARDNMNLVNDEMRAAVMARAGERR